MLIFLFFILSFCINSEIFNGIVLDSNNIPIEKADVQLTSDQDSYGTITDSDGFFIISDVKGKNYVLTISHIGYNNYVSDINLPLGEYLKINMISKTVDLDRVVVTGTRSERHIKDTPMLTHVIDSKDIRNSTYSNVKDILEMAMPNVQTVSSNHGNDRVKIQGLDNKYLTFLVDGDRVSGEFAGNIDFSMLSLSNVKKIEVIEGAMSTIYGSGSIGGVVNIVTEKNQIPYFLRTELQYDNPIGITRLIEAGMNRGILNYMFSIHENTTDGYDLSPQENTYNMTLNENNSKIYSHSFDFDLNKKHHLNIFHKRYFSRTNNFKFDAGSLFLDAPLNRYHDNYYKVKHKYKISDFQTLKISYLNEEYLKYYFYPYYYSNNQYLYNPEEFINGTLNRKELNLNFNSESNVSKRLIGLELFDEKYSSFNIYYPDGDILQESIFQGQNLTKKQSGLSLYFYEERNLSKKNILSLGLRIQNIADDDILLPSISYLVKGNNDYNYRLSYTKGYREPSIKERFYQWEDHAGPDIIGNSQLLPTENNYYSLSFDKRTWINDFSMDFYRNEIKNMISTEYDDIGNLVYMNYEKVIIHGTNVHYYRKISKDLKLKFVYNLTIPSSKSDEILEGISKHSLRLKLDYQILKKLNLTANIKYSGEKFIFDQEQDFVSNLGKIELSDYFLTDLYFSSNFKNSIFIFGVKNLFDYKDSRRYYSDILNNYDPGRRLYVKYSFLYGKD